MSGLVLGEVPSTPAKTFFSEANMYNQGPGIEIGIMRLKGMGRNALREDGIFKVQA